MSSNQHKLEDEHYWRHRPLKDKRRDWNPDAENWIEDYVRSIDHPHRDLILNILAMQEPFRSVLEVGCNVGSNLSRIRSRFRNLMDGDVFGIDASKLAIARAKEIQPTVKFEIGVVTKLPYIDKSFDIVLTDAVLIYVDNKNIHQAIKELVRVTRKVIVMVEWYDSHSSYGVIKDHHWARDYEKLLNAKGWATKKRKLTKRQWPNKNWIRNGYIFTSVPR